MRRGLQLSDSGWAPVDAVLAALARDGQVVDWNRLLHVVESNDKQRS